MSGTNLYASTINPNVFVDLTNENGYVDTGELRGTTSLPIDTGLFSKGCVLKVEDNGTMYINTAADGLTPSWVGVGTGVTGITELTGDVSAGPGSGSQVSKVVAIQTQPVAGGLNDVGSTYIKLSGSTIYSTSGAIASSGDTYNESAFIIGSTKRLTVGGSASEDFTIHNIDDNSGIQATLNNPGSNNVSIVSANYSGVNTITVVFSADPGNDAIITLTATRLTSYLD